MFILPSQETFLNQISRSKEILPGQLMTNPFFFEWLFCSDLSKKELPWQLRDIHSGISSVFQIAKVKLAEFASESAVIQHSLIQYRSMKEEFASIEKDFKDIIKIIECCFQVAANYWEVIKNYLHANSFGETKHEIYFFKNIKPAFTSERNFLSLACHALLSRKETDNDVKFWKREKQRRNKLLLEHSDFFPCYLNGKDENDDSWFTRTTTLDYTKKDHIVSSWFAINRYEVFIELAILQQTL